MGWESGPTKSAPSGSHAGNRLSEQLELPLHGFLWSLCSAAMDWRLGKKVVPPLLTKMRLWEQLLEVVGRKA